MKRFVLVSSALAVWLLLSQSTLVSAQDCSVCEPDCACEPDCCCECGDGCCDGCCDSCDGWGWGNCLGDCCLGDPWTLQDCLTPCCDSPEYGGWVSMGYYNNCERLSTVPGQELSFNDFPNHLNLDQAWFYVGKEADADCCSADYGYRFDVMYGAQAHAAQAFGNPGGQWDASWDYGVYGWAIPQLYGEVAYGDWSIIAGHFWTIAGYEVVPAVGNFFYSHSLTQYNSEPFTHTGVLATYNGAENLTFYGGWTLGWDTGFDQFGGGSNFLGGVTAQVCCDVSLTYVTTIGNLGWRSGNRDGYSQSVVMIADLTSSMTWVAMSDYLATNGVAGDPTFENFDYGLTNYLFYELNDCWSVGGRAEWWKSNNITTSGRETSFYDITGGINYRPHANLVIRPEIRYDWSPTELFSVVNGARYNQTWFGIDAVLTY